MGMDEGGNEHLQVQTSFNGNHTFTYKCHAETYADTYNEFLDIKVQD